MSAPLLTAEEVAERLKVPRTWVYRAAREGELPSVRCGRYRRFDADDVDHWIEEQKGSLGLRAAAAVAPPTSQA